MNQEKTDRSNR